MKRLILILTFAFILSPFAFGQSRTNTLTRPCPGSATPARVTIAVGGNITATPCSGGTVTINGTVIPQGVKVYRALLTQSSTSAPVATVLENTLGGTVVWARTNAGIYTATLASAFPAGKAFIRVGTSYAPTMVVGLSTTVRTSANVITLNSWEFDIAGATEALVDGALLETSFEVIVYP